MCAVEWKSLEELGNFYGGLSGKSKDDFQDGNAKFVTYMNVYSNMSLDLTIVDMVKVGEDEKQNSIKYGDILFTGSSETPDDCGMSCVVTRHVDEPIYLNSFCFGFRFDDVEKFEPDFLKHYFRCIAMRKAISLTASGVTRFNVSKKRFGKIQIPLLAVSKQQEIVSHLDTFTTLIFNLESELDMRRKQYEHYRNQLLDFEGVEKLPLSEVFEMRGGYTPSTKNEEFWEDGILPWFRMEDIRENGNILSDSTLHITPIAVKKNGLFPMNSIILATSATIGVHALLTVPALSNQRFTAFYPKEKYEDKVNYKYTYYYFYIIDEWCKNNTVQGGFASVDMAGLRKYLFSLPSLTKQQEIVEKLDAFENLIQLLEQEIKLRKQQYEYYREKLLTFEKE